MSRLRVAHTRDRHVAVALPVISRIDYRSFLASSTSHFLRQLMVDAPMDVSDGYCCAVVGEGRRRAGNGAIQGIEETDEWNLARQH